MRRCLQKGRSIPEKKKWCLIGGRIRKNEETKEAIDRQAREELGVSVRIVNPWTEEMPLAVFNDHRVDAQKHFIALTFPVVITKGIVNASGPEFSESRWFPLNALPKPLGFHYGRVLAVLKSHNRTRPIRW